MGCGTSRKFRVNSDIQGQDQFAAEVFRHLGLDDTDVNMLYTAFWDIDADESGTIRPIEFFAYFNIEIQDFEKFIFSVFDLDKSGVLTFLEFVCCIWNLLTLPESLLGTVLYLMKDPTAVMKIKATDVKSILEIVTRKRTETSPSLAAVYDGFKRQFTSDVSLKEFCGWTALNMSVVQPVLMLQLQLRKQIIGESYWLKMAQERKQHPEQGQYAYVKALQKLVDEKTQQYAHYQNSRSLKSQVSDKKFGNTTEGALQEHSDRKHSILLTAFGMKPGGFGDTSSKSAKSKKAGGTYADDSKLNKNKNRVHASASADSPKKLGEEREAFLFDQRVQKKKPKAQPVHGADDHGRPRRSSFFNRPKLIKVEQHSVDEIAHSKKLSKAERKAVKKRQQEEREAAE